MHPVGAGPAGLLFDGREAVRFGSDRARSDQDAIPKARPGSSDASLAILARPGHSFQGTLIVWKLQDAPRISRPGYTRVADRGDRRRKLEARSSERDGREMRTRHGHGTLAGRTAKSSSAWNPRIYWG
jgi:hypothetical protein